MANLFPVFFKLRTRQTLANYSSAYRYSKITLLTICTWLLGQIKAWSWVVWWDNIIIKIFFKVSKRAHMLKLPTQFSKCKYPLKLSQSKPKIPPRIFFLYYSFIVYFCTTNSNMKLIKKVILKSGNSCLDLNVPRSHFENKISTLSLQIDAHF